MLEVLDSDYVRTAKAKGISQARVVIRHALRNALIPVLTMFSMDFGSILGGALVVETVFGWPGMSHLLVSSVRQYDPHMLMGWLVVTATMIILCNLLADLLYAVLDPRVRVV
ncbi:ABC transporter permease [Lentzea sp. NPDC004789]